MAFDQLWRKGPHHSSTHSRSKCVLFSVLGFQAEGLPDGRSSHSRSGRNAKASQQNIELIACRKGENRNANNL